MYKITLYDQNCSPVCDGTVCFFTEDIEDFQKRWFRTNCVSEEEKERFLRSKAGEIVTDYYSDSPELNIVQYDTDKVYSEKTMELENETFEAFNVYHWSEQYHVNRWTICFKWICFKGEYFRIASYKANGVCMYSEFVNRWKSVCCYGNPVLENTVKYDPSYDRRVDESEWDNPGFDQFEENRIETICWLTNEFFASEQELKDDISTFKVTKEIMDRLFWDVIGEAG